MTSENVPRFHWKMIYLVDPPLKIRSFGALVRKITPQKKGWKWQAVQWDHLSKCGLCIYIYIYSVYVFMSWFEGGLLPNFILNWKPVQSFQNRGKPVRNSKRHETGKTSMILTRFRPASWASRAIHPRKRGRLVSFGSRSVLFATMRTRIFGLLLSSCHMPFWSRLPQSPSMSRETPEETRTAWKHQLVSGSFSSHL